MTREVGPEAWESRSGPDVVAVRWQVPLQLAWAISVHKCQGMTLDRVVVSLKNVFEQYVSCACVRAQPL